MSVIAYSMPPPAAQPLDLPPVVTNGAAPVRAKAVEGLPVGPPAGAEDQEAVERDAEPTADRAVVLDRRGNREGTRRQCAGCAERRQGLIAAGQVGPLPIPFNAEHEPVELIISANETSGKWSAPAVTVWRQHGARRRRQSPGRPLPGKPAVRAEVEPGPIVRRTNAGHFQRRPPRKREQMVPWC
jgi:hypothetical protein